MINIFKTLYYEFKSYFVPEKVTYNLKGKCLQCGKCCNYMYSKDTYTEKEFRIMQFLFPPYKRFYIKGKDDEGNFIFACKLVTPQGKCSVYSKRLRMCRNYPVKRLPYKPVLHDGCGYYFEDKDFNSYLHK